MGKRTIAYKLIGNQERAFAYHFDRIDTTNWGIFRAIHEKQKPRERERKRRELKYVLPCDHLTANKPFTKL